MFLHPREQSRKPDATSSLAFLLFAVALLAGCSVPEGGAKTTEVEALPALRLVGLLHDDQALIRPHDVELQGNLAFVAGKSGSLAVIDISDPAEPKVLSAIVGPQTIEDAETVLPMGDTLLLGTRSFHAVDIRDPAKPELTKTITDRAVIDKINGMAKRGLYVFTANKTGFVNVFDVSNPADPKLHDTLNTVERAAQTKPHDIAAFGDRIVVVDSATGASAAVQVYRVADEATHELLPAEKWEIEGSVPAGDATWDIGGANRVAVSGNYAYIGAYRPDRVGIIDISDPKNIRQVGNIPVCDIDATGLDIAGQILFVAGGECIEAIDVSNPEAPVSLAQYRGGDLFPTRRLLVDGEWRFDNAHDLVYRDGYIYITAQNDNQFGILKVEDELILRRAMQ
ncbi:MAG: hypothetical protein O2968_12625 [Acidobacteria bacterium]|nr:hypothetical protein [Acidobacteriota bacterium]